MFIQSPRYAGLTLLLLLFGVVLSGCKEGASGGDEIIEPAAGAGNSSSTAVAANVPANLLIVDKDSPDASDANDGKSLQSGGTGPVQTILRALELASPGDTIRIRESVTPYSESVAGDSFGPGGIRISVGGTASQPLVIESIDGERPVIDQGRFAADIANPIAGFVLMCVSHVTIRGLEIRNVNEAGISSLLIGCESSGLTFEDLHIHSVTGASQVAGVRLANVSQSTVRNNLIHDVTTAALDVPSVGQLAVAARSEDNLIEQNTIRDVDTGVLLHGDGAAESVSGTTVRFNLIEDVTTGIELSALDASDINDTLVHANVVLRASTAIDANLDNSATQSRGLEMSANTFVDNDVAIRITALIDASIVNSIFADSRVAYLVALDPTPVHLATGFAEIEHNLYSNALGVWALEQDPMVVACAANPQCFDVFSDWQLAVGAGASLPTNPDVISEIADPQFIDPVGGDYRVQPGSPAVGLSSDGGTVGAFGASDTIGSGL